MGEKVKEREDGGRGREGEMKEMASPPTKTQALWNFTHARLCVLFQNEVVSGKASDLYHTFQGTRSIEQTAIARAASQRRQR